MNQILSTDSNNRKEKNNRNFVEPEVMKKVAIVFSILLMVFAITIIGIELFQMFGNKEDKYGGLNQPEINIEKIDDNQVKITTAYDEGISKVSWWWNNDLSKITEKNYELKEISIDIPEGETNILHVKVIGQDGSISEKEQTLEREINLDNPTVEWNQIPESDYMQIVAKSEKGVAKISYHWNEEEETVVEATEENQKELTVTIQTKRGTNRLYTTVTDIEGNIHEKEDLLSCVKQPVINVTANSDQKLIVIEVTHDMGLQKIEFTVNGQKFTYDENTPIYDEAKTTLTFTAELKEGTNTVIVDAYSLEKIRENENTYAHFAGETEAYVFD